MNKTYDVNLKDNVFYEAEFLFSPIHLIKVLFFVNTFANFRHKRLTLEIIFVIFIIRQ